MKAKLYITVCAAALLANTGARADCPNGHVPSAGGVISIPSVTVGFGSFTIGGGVPQDAFDSGSQTDANCVTAGSVAIGGAPAVTGAWQVADPANTPGDPSDDISVYLPPASAVLGQNSSALGNGATVGRVETYMEGGVDGVLGDDPSTLADESLDDVQQTRIVPINNGTAIGANASVEHNNSTAIGAGAKSTDDHQVTVGTADETIRAPGITSQKSKDRQVGSIELVTSDSDGRLATDGGATVQRIQATEDKNAEQDARHDTAEAKNSEQDGRLDANDTKNAQQDGRLTGVETKNAEQDGRLNTHDGQIASVQAHNVIQDGRLGSLETIAGQHELRLDTHGALLSQHASTLRSHGQRLDKVERGVAISLAMPDAWLSDRENFAIAGNLGFFGDEAALGFKAIVRIDQTWSMNAGIAADTGFEDVGGTVGFRAGW